MKLKTLVCLSLITFVVMLSSAVQAQTFSVIHSFSSPFGLTALAGVTLHAGVLYGTTECMQHPLSGCFNGTVYQLSHVGSSWNYALISLLSSNENSESRVVFGPDNHLYSTTIGSSQGFGIVFNLTPPASLCRTANCFWTKKDLHQFQGSPDGSGPYFGDLVWDSMGNIDETTHRGGSSTCNPPQGCGTVSQMTKSGDNWTEKPIYSFAGRDGQNPAGGVVLDGSGDLFGTTQNGGLYNSGTVFELTYTIGVGWTETVLYDFQNLSDGQWPIGGLLMDNAGNLYGTTWDGGSGLGGTVFELSPVGDTWAFTTLYSLSGKANCGPLAALTMDGSGDLYGTTSCDGSNHLGSVFKLKNTQNGWEYTSLHDFTGSSDGELPISNVTIDTDGTLYGTASKAGSSGCDPSYTCGTVWMIKP